MHFNYSFSDVPKSNFDMCQISSGQIPGRVKFRVSWSCDRLEVVDSWAGYQSSDMPNYKKDYGAGTGRSKLGIFGARVIKINDKAGRSKHPATLKI